jgi:hypothetical protein
MTSGPIIEIIELDYCIKLRRNTFNLSLLRQLINRVQAEQFSSNDSDEECDFSIREQTTFDQNFDRLSDK